MRSFGAAETVKTVIRGVEKPARRSPTHSARGEGVSRRLTTTTNEVTVAAIGICRTKDTARSLSTVSCLSAGVTAAVPLSRFATFGRKTTPLETATRLPRTHVSMLLVIIFPSDFYPSDFFHNQMAFCRFKSPTGRLVVALERILGGKRVGNRLAF